MTIHEEIKQKWNSENVPDTYRHITIDKWLKNIESLNAVFKKYVLDVIDVKDKTVIDYGIGGGWLGKLLLENGIKKYIGYDICDNSLEFAKANLNEYENKKILNVKDYPDFSKQHADLFISLECIQHFPNEEYLNKWLEMVNNSGCEDLILQYRFGNKIKFMSKDVYTFSCTLPRFYMDKYLTNYKNWGRYRVVYPNINKEYVYYRKKNEN